MDFFFLCTIFYIASSAAPGIEPRTLATAALAVKSCHMVDEELPLSPGMSYLLKGVSQNLLFVFCSGSRFPCRQGHHIGFGVFIVHSSMVAAHIPVHVCHSSQIHLDLIWSLPCLQGTHTCSQSETPWHEVIPTVQ